MRGPALWGRKNKHTEKKGLVMNKIKIEMKDSESEQVSNAMKEYTKKELAIVYTRVERYLSALDEWIRCEFGDFEIDENDNLIFENPPFADDEV